MPAAIRSFIWRIGYEALQGKAVPIPPDKLDVCRCLQEYHRLCFEDVRPTITEPEIKGILTQHASPGLDIQYLIKNELLSYDGSAGVYTPVYNARDTNFNNEVAAMLWLLVADKIPSLTDFKHWLKRILVTEMYVSDLSRHLSYDQLIMITKLAFEMLLAEDDLHASPQEFAKIWLDNAQYQRADITVEIPPIQFDYSSAWNYISDVQYHRRSFYDLFDNQRTRSLYNMVIQTIIRHSKDYQHIIELCHDITRPYLCWHLFREIPIEHPVLLPYLLKDAALAPLVFQQVDKTELKAGILSPKREFDEQLEDSCRIKNEWWLEMFDLLLNQLDCSPTNLVTEGEMVAKIILQAAHDTFYYATNRGSSIRHKYYKIRYDEALKVLAGKRLKRTYGYSSSSINPRLYFLILPAIVQYMKVRHSNKRPGRTENTTVASGFFDCCIEFLRLSIRKPDDSEIPNDINETINSSTNGLINLVTEQLEFFYAASIVEVATNSTAGIEDRSIRRDTMQFGFEIIDWGFLYLVLYQSGQFEKVEKCFRLNHSVNDEISPYDSFNREQLTKIKVWLKSMMLAFLSVYKQKAANEADGLPAEEFLKKAEPLIAGYALEISKKGINKAGFNIFEETNTQFADGQYQEPMIRLLFRCLNHFSVTSQANFINSFFQDSVNLGLMLSAVNTVLDPVLIQLISKKIEAVDIEAFFKASAFVTELQDTLIDAVNSKGHWALAKPLIERIQRHYKAIKYDDFNITEFLFEVSVLVHFKEKDMQALEALALPSGKHRSAEQNRWAGDIKKYYVALYHLYNSKDYDSAGQLLKSLLSSDTKNLRYAFYLYQSRILKAIGTDTPDKNLILHARKEWEDFVAKPDNSHTGVLVDFSEQIEGSNFYYYVTVNDIVNADRVLGRLSAPFLYDEPIVPFIYAYYISRNMHELAYDYILKAHHYLLHEGAVPRSVLNLVAKADTPHLIHQVKLSLGRVLTLKPESIVQVSPDILNDKRNLDDFIFHELLLAADILRDKIQAVKQSTKEDPFTDLLLASLRLRFPFWGWNITDQQRTGKSPTGKGAGEVDITIQAAGKTIALLEALVLKSGDFKKTSEHILKCFGYIGYLPRYYIIIYYKGPRANFAKTWEAYKLDVLKTPFSAETSIDSVKGFEDLAVLFSNPRNVFVARTWHNSGVQIFHLMINLTNT